MLLQCIILPVSQEQRRTLYTDLRSAEAKEASCVEKRLSDEQITATRLAEEHDACRYDTQPCFHVICSRSIVLRQWFSSFVPDLSINPTYPSLRVSLKVW